MEEIKRLPKKSGHNFLILTEEEEDFVIEAAAVTVDDKNGNDSTAINVKKETDVPKDDRIDLL